MKRHEEMMTKPVKALSPWLRLTKATRLAAHRTGIGAVVLLLASAALAGSEKSALAQQIFPPRAAEPSAGSQQLQQRDTSGVRTRPSLSDLGVQPDGADPLAPTPSNFIEGINYDENGTNNGGSRFIPPDPHGAPGPLHTVSVVNASIEFHLKSTGAQQLSQSLQTFFAPLSPLNKTFDPKVIYDQYEGRFVVVTLEVTGRGSATGTSRILLAVSDDSDPNGTWNYYAIDSKVNIGGVDTWADYPGFAVDEQAVYITANHFTFDTSANKGSRLYIVNKAPFYSGGAGTSTITDPSGVNGGTLQPAHTFGAGGVPGTTGTFLVVAGFSYGNGDDALKIIRVDNPLTSPTFDSQFINVSNIDTSTLADAPQLGGSGLIETNDSRALNAIWRNNALYTCNTVNPPSGPDAGQATAHWYKINTSNLASLALADQGNVGGEDIAAGTYTFFPSVAVDSADNMGIGFAASAPTIYAGAYFTGRLATDPAATVQTSGTIAAGIDYYVRTFGGARNRWGDYSAISIDPTDDATFVVFNQYALTQEAGAAAERGRWGTRFGSFVLAATTNEAPTTKNSTVFLNEDTPVSFNLSARDEERAPLTYTLVTLPQHGTLSGDAPNLTYTPAANYNGEDSFTFRVNDGTQDSNISTVRFHIAAVNDAPVAQSQSVTTTRNNAKQITLGATDVDNANLSYNIVSGPTHGTLSGSGKTRVYTPNTGYSGSDSFTFNVSDGSLTSGTATVSITVNAVPRSNTAPTAKNQFVALNEDMPASITLSGSDAEGDALTYIIVTPPTKGVLSGSGANLTYTPNPNANGSDSFTFKTNDGSLDSSPAKVTLAIQAVNDAPVAQDQSVSTPKNTTKTIVLRATDVDNGSLSYSIVTQPQHGSVTLSGNVASYTPAAGYVGGDSFTFRANDGNTNSTIATVSITVTN